MFHSTSVIYEGRMDSIIHILSGARTSYSISESNPEL